MSRKIIRRLRSTEFFPILLGLVLFISYPALDLIISLTDGLFTIFFTLFTVLSLSILIHQPAKLRTGIILALFTLIPHWILYFAPEYTVLTVLRVLSILVFTIFIGIALFSNIVKHESVVFETLLGVIVGYMLLGVIGSEICLNLWLLDPASYDLKGAAASPALLYYSFMTLLTVGYGDIIPATAAARVVAIFLGITGQVYLTVIVALFIGKFLASRNI